jgi:hypothetical protein
VLPQDWQQWLGNAANTVREWAYSPGRLRVRMIWDRRDALELRQPMEGAAGLSGHLRPPNRRVGNIAGSPERRVKEPRVRLESRRDVSADGQPWSR